MSIRSWLLGVCVIAGLGCPPENNTAPGSNRTGDAGDEDDGGRSGGAVGKSSDQCPPTQQACGTTGCIPKLAACCNPITTSYCINNAGGGCYDTPRCGTEYCCATNMNLGSYDCPLGEHHCGKGCRPVGEGCCARSTDLCTPDDAVSGGAGSGFDAGADGSANVDAAMPDRDAATMSGTDAGDPGTPTDDRCCACNFDVYCTEFGAGGCWYCNNAHYDASNVCPAPEGYLVSPGACTCDPELYQICM